MLAVFPMLRVELSYHEESPFGWDGFYPIDSCRLLPLVILRHAPYCQQACCLRFQEQLLQLLYLSLVATLTGSIDALLHAVHVLL